MHPSKFDPKKHHRKSIRLQGYDYSQGGAYFVTIITHQRDCLFGEIVNEEMKLNDFGKIADEYWSAIPQHFPFVELGAYVIMPNHVHGIIVINDTHKNNLLPPIVGARHASPLLQKQLPPRGAPPRSLGTIMGSFKSAVTKRIGRKLNATGIWQRNYYEHIIRDEQDLKNKTDYIDANPMLWNDDDENPRHNS